MLIELLLIQFIFLINYIYLKFVNFCVILKEFLYKYIIVKKMENQQIKTNAEKSKEYRQNNPPTICDRCGGKIHYSKKNAHEKSKKHLWAIENNFYFKKEN